MSVRKRSKAATPALPAPPGVPWAPSISLDEMRANLGRNGPQLYIGAASRGLVWAGHQQALLVLGPPRSGKTSSLVVPNTLAAPGPVVVTSTKPDVLVATMASRARLGRCWLLDPTGTVAPHPGVIPLRWSPVEASASWEEALVMARVMSQAARPDGRAGDSAHWTERAEALLGPLLHAAALAGGGARQVLTWILRQDLQTPMAVLGTTSPQGELAVDVLGGIAATEERERSGIFSTAAGTMAAYRSARALEQADGPNFDPANFPDGADTVYVCAPARHQALVAPVVVAFLEQVRAATYARSASAGLRLPVTLVLDEVANIAPLPDLPAMVSEGGGQGLLTMACLQDLSQARARWGQAAEGFFSLFGAKVVLPGIADMRTLETVSRLAGHADVPVRSVTVTPWWTGRPSASTTRSWRRQPRLPVDMAYSLPTGSALVLAGARPPALARLTPWWCYPPFREARKPTAEPIAAPGNLLPAGAPIARVTGMPVPPSPRPGTVAPAPDMTVTWQRVPGQRRLHPPPPQA